VPVIVAGEWSQLSKLSVWERGLTTISGNFLYAIPQAVLFLLMVGLVLLSVARRSNWPVVFGIVLPFFALWALTFGYSVDMRNVSLAMPFVALSAAEGVRIVWASIRPASVSASLSTAEPLQASAPYPLSASHMRAAASATLTAVLLLVTEVVWPINRLAAGQIAEQVALYPSITAPLYRLDEAGRLDHGKIFTTFDTMRVLPRLRRHYAFLPGRFDAALLSKAMSDHTIGYLLIRNDGVVENQLKNYEMDAATRKQLAEALTDGRLVALAEFGIPWAEAGPFGEPPKYQLLAK
jgi:hypothetical protein